MRTNQAVMSFGPKSVRSLPGWRRRGRVSTDAVWDAEREMPPRPHDSHYIAGSVFEDRERLAGGTYPVTVELLYEFGVQQRETLAFRLKCLVL